MDGATPQATPAPHEMARCAFVPYMNRCDRAGQYGGYCLHHSNEKCSVCGKQATHMCGGWVGSFVCGASVCDECDNWSAGTVHDHGSLPGRSMTVEAWKAREIERRAELEALQAARAEHRRLHPPMQDPRYLAEADPQNWTLGLLVERGVGMRGYCPECKAWRSLPIELRQLVADGKGERKVADIKITCHECDRPGQIEVLWRNENHSCSHNMTTGEAKGRWPCVY